MDFDEGSTMILGIFCGLSAAFSQSLSYFATRNYVQRRAAAPARVSASRQLLVLSHVWMGVFACLGLPLVWPAGGVGGGRVILLLVLSVFCYTSGQVGLVSALEHAEASRVSPLMTSKLILSSILVMIYGQPVGDSARWLTILQWVGVGLCIVAGISINFTGGRMTGKAIASIAWSAASFSLSDWFINQSIAVFKGQGMESFRASMLVLVLLHAALGVVATGLLSIRGSRRRRDWIDALPYALTWTGAMIGLFSAFAQVGIMLGSILQCTRSFITILMGAAIMRMGHHHIEPHAPRGVMLRRLGAGLLMFAGITLYVVKDEGQFWSLFHRSGPLSIMGEEGQGRWLCSGLGQNRRSGGGGTNC